MALRPTQMGFQEYLLHGKEEILDQVRGSSRADTRTMMGVYQYAYKARLIECLGSDYPALKIHLGEGAFANLAGRYIDAHPSAFTSVRWIGKFLPAFLRKEPAYKDQILLHDLATFEWQVGLAFDGEDGSYASMADLTMIPPHSFAELRLLFHPTLSSLTLRTDAPLWRERLLKEESCADLGVQTAPRDWLIWRQDLDVRYRPLEEEDEAHCYHIMQKGACFADMCDDLIAFVGEERAAIRAAEIMRGWLDLGMIREIEYDANASVA